jgi:asparagine synthase (glutamine-hydrolysing)
MRFLGYAGRHAGRKGKSLPVPGFFPLLSEGPIRLCVDVRPQDVYRNSAAGLTIVVVGGRHRPAGTLQTPLAPGDLDEFAKNVAGCSVITCSSREVRLSSDHFGLSPVYLAADDGGVYFSSSATLLARFLKKTVAPEWLASYLISGDPPDILLSISPFEGIRALPPAHWLRISQDRISTRRYWTPPAPMRSLQEGASRLREALQAAVERRIGTSNQPTADLSGGFDSSTLVAIAAECLGASRTLKAVIGVPNSEVPFEDRAYAEAVATCANVELAVLSVSQTPPPLAPPPAGLTTEEPTMMLCATARFAHLLGVIRGMGSDIHLSGQGGDAVLEAPALSYLPGLIRRGRVGTAMRHAVAGRAGTRELPIRMVAHATALSAMSYEKWMMRQRTSLLNGDLPRELGWGIPVRRPPWLTERAVEYGAARLATCAQENPLDVEDPGLHASLLSILSTARASRLAADVADRVGVVIEFPYFDPEVVEVCLSVQPHERTRPDMLKPLLSTAFESRLPRGFFERRLKTSPWVFTNDMFDALRSRRAWISDLFKGSLLAEMQLINRERFVDALEELTFRRLDHFAAAIDTVAAEIWLQETHHLRSQDGEVLL